MQEYLLKVGKAAASESAKLLELPNAPTHVRLALMAPVSNWGYPPNTVGHLLKISTQGLVMGLEDNHDAPHDFIPWQNVAYVSDGTRLATEVAKQRR